MYVLWLTYWVNDLIKGPGSQVELQVDQSPAINLKQLAPIASPMDKIVWGRKHQIDEWLGDAYWNVCMRPESFDV